MTKKIKSKMDIAFQEFNKKFNEEVCFMGSAERAKPINLPSGILKFDKALGGGLTIGKMHEFGGDNHAGKTLLSLIFCKQAQKIYPDKVCVFVDVECRFDPIWAKKLGVNTDDLYVFNPLAYSAETILDTVVEFIDTGEASLVVVDSLGALVSGLVIDGSLSDNAMANTAKTLTRFCNKVVGKLARTGTTLININQVRDEFGSLYPVYKTTGGKAAMHMHTSRIQFRKGAFVDRKGKELNSSAENPQGNKIHFTIHKLNSSLINRRGEFTLFYNEGIDYYSDLIDLAEYYNIFIKGGAWYSCIDSEEKEIFKIQGKAKVVQFLKDNEEFYKLIANKIVEIMNKESE